jgi:hypothetical protein
MSAGRINSDVSLSGVMISLSIRHVLGYCDMASKIVEADLRPFGILRRVGSYFPSGTTYCSHIQGSSSQKRMPGAIGRVIIEGTAWDVVVNQEK